MNLQKVANSEIGGGAVYVSKGADICHVLRPQQAFVYLNVVPLLGSFVIRLALTFCRAVWWGLFMQVCQAARGNG